MGNKENKVVDKIKKVENYILGEDMVVDIGEVYPNDWNPKDKIEDSKENKQMYEEIKEELRKKGQFEGVTVRERENGEGGKYQILDGFHRWLGTRELERPRIRINNLGKIDDLLARAITVVKEKKKVPVSELKLAELISQMSEDGTSKEIIADLFGMDEEKIGEYVKMSDFEWEDYKADIVNAEENDVVVEEDETIKLSTFTIRLKKDEFLSLKEIVEKNGKSKFLDELLKI